MNEILAHLLKQGMVTKADSEEIKEAVETVDSIGAIVRVFSETKGAKDIIASLGNVIGELWRNLTEEQKIPKDVAAQIITGISKLKTTKAS